MLPCGRRVRCGTVASFRTDLRISLPCSENSDNPICASDLSELARRRAERMQSLVEIGFWDEHRRLMAGLELEPAGFDIRPDGALRIGGETAPGRREELARIVRGLLPWRKGPISLYGVEIDAEWRAERKWERIAPALGRLEGLRVADVGCNNGYYMFRLLQAGAASVLGFDPNGRFYYQFELLRRLSGETRLSFEPLGVEDLDLFPGRFDLALFLGVIYHRRDPYGALAGLRESLRPGGRLILESLAIPGREPICLCPPSRYGKMRNVWFVPSLGALEAWLVRSGFKQVETVSAVELSPDEQRATPLAPYESLDDFLDPADRGRTVEGYPAPLRVALSALRG